MKRLILAALLFTTPAFADTVPVVTPHDAAELQQMVANITLTAKDAHEVARLMDLLAAIAASKPAKP